MEILKKKSIVLKIVIAVVFVILFNFCSPTVSLGADGLLEQIGGTLLSPIVDLLVSIGDGTIYLIQSIMFGMSESTVKISTVTNDIFGTISKILIGALAVAVFILVPGVGAGLVAAGAAIAAGSYAASVIENTWLPDTFYLPLYAISPEEIFQNRIALLDVNFFNPNKYEDITTSVGVGGEQQTSTAEMLQGTISSWYLTLRNLALVVLLSVLVYIGIRIIISSTAQDKAKYKERLFSWGVAVALLFFMHYIMAFATTIVEAVSEGINKANAPVVLVMPDLTDYYIETKDYERDADGNLLETDDEGNPTGELKTVHVDANQFFEENLKDPDTNQYLWPTNLMGKVRLDMQLEMPDVSEDNILLRKLGYTILFLILVFYTVAFLIVYVKRIIMLAFLTMIAPLVAMTYPLDKMKDGNAQAFNMWIKEYVFNLLIQPLHLILYTMLVGSAITMAANEASANGATQDANINMIYAIVAIGFIFQSEKILRKFFGFDQASTLENGSAIGGALAMATVHQLGKLNRIGGKGNKGKNGGQNGEGKKNDRVRTADKGRSTRDLLAAQANDGQNDGQGNDRDEVMERYGAEGFGQNANGEYFNPYTDEYDPDYDPHNDSSYAQTSRNQNPSPSGNSSRDSSPVTGTIRTVQTEEEEPWNIKGWTEDDTRGAGAYIRDSWRNSGLRDNLANNRYVRAIGNAGGAAADRARRAGNAIGNFGRSVHDLAGRGVRMMPKPIRNSIRGAAGAVGGAAAVVGGRLKEKLPDAGRLIARGAAGAALGVTAGTIGVAAGLASGDDKNILSMGAAGLGAGAALGSGLAGSAMNADIKGGMDKIASEYTIKTKGIEAEKQRQKELMDKEAIKDKGRQELYKEKLELSSKADVKKALEDAQKYRESGITDDELIIKAMKAEGFNSDRASDERIALAGLASDIKSESSNTKRSENIEKVQKRLKNMGIDETSVNKYVNGLRDITNTT